MFHRPWRSNFGDIAGFQRYIERSRLPFHSTRVRYLCPLWPFGLSRFRILFSASTRNDRVGLYFTIRRVFDNSNAGVSSLSFHPFVTRRIVFCWDMPNARVSSFCALSCHWTCVFVNCQTFHDFWQFIFRDPSSGYSERSRFAAYLWRLDACPFTMICVSSFFLCSFSCRAVFLF